MPEGPEVHLAAKFVNQFAAGRLFAGRVEKSAVSTKNPDVPWDAPAYSIRAAARGKELRMKLTEVAGRKGPAREMDILFRFGMSGKMEVTEKGKWHKHSHLRFFTQDGRMTLSFVDQRRFGRWLFTDQWSADRGPCVLTETSELADHLTSRLDTSALRGRPICEVLLDQRLFNGIGNYLRAEILHRAGVPPFDPADEVLAPLREGATPAVLRLASEIPWEVVTMNIGSGAAPSYMNDPEASSRPHMDAFFAWLRCYGREGMQTLADAHGRTVWFAGPPGRLQPKGARVKRQSASLKRRVNAAAADKEEEEERGGEPARPKVTKKKPKEARTEGAAMNGDGGPVRRSTRQRSARK